MPEPVLLHGDRIVLREWRLDDVRGMHRWFGNLKVRRFLDFGAESLAGSEAHLLNVVAPSQTLEPRTDYYLAVELCQTGLTIGNAGFSWKSDGVAEIGYFLEPGSWGQGFATEAAELLIHYAFDLGAKLVIAECDAKNSASERVMRRCGMEMSGERGVGKLAYAIQNPTRK
jgi:ribosomal-protein-alanine N-acetyltransferase